MNAQSTVLIWDWDGTLLYTRPAFEKAFGELQREFPCPYFSAENFEALLKNWGAFWEGCPLPAEEKTKAMQFYGSTYKKVNTSASHLMPQAKAVLSWAKEAGFKQMLVSNKVQWAIEGEIEHFGLKDYFLKIQGVEPGLHPDKKPSLTYGAKALAGINHTDVIVIGDSKDDILFAQNLSAKCLYLGDTATPDFNGQHMTNLADVQTFLKNSIHERPPLTRQFEGRTH